MRLITTALAAAALLSAVITANAHDYEVVNVEIGHPWSRATLPNAPVAGGYMTITNTGTAADRLIGGATPAAADVQIHEMTMDGDVMKMRQIEGGLEIPAGETVTLAPGGFHLMLTKPVKRLMEGDRVPLTLRFEKAGTVEVELVVDKPNARGPEGAAPEGEHAGHGAMQMK